jgi:CRP-like cAMP-binding protein
MSVLEGGRVSESAETLEDCELASIPREELLALLYKDRDVSIRFIKMLSKEVKESETRLLELAYASVRQRVAQALLRLRVTYGKREDKDLGLRISREDLATIVGTATESLIRTLSDLKDEGWWSCRAGTSGSVTPKDWSAWRTLDARRDGHQLAFMPFGVIWRPYH